jgi:tetratricopeptide (TPR) repeat protein
MENDQIWADYLAGDHEKVLVQGAHAAGALHITGLSLVALGRFDEAINMLTVATMAKPLPVWFSNTMVALLEAGEAKRALDYVSTIPATVGNDGTIRFMIGNVFVANDMNREAEEHFEAATFHDPTNWEFRLNLGNCYRRLDKFDKAIQAYDNAVLHAPTPEDVIRIKMNTAVVHSDDANYREALRLFNKLAETPGIDSPELDFNRGTLNLMLGDFEKGWKLYDRRWDCPMASTAKAAFLRPRLPSLEAAKGKHVLFSHEQGFGDSIQFVRYAKLLAEHCEVTILCPEPLVRLFQCLGLPVISDRSQIDDYDYECPMLDAPLLFGTTLDTIPAAPYLIIPDDIIHDHRALFGGALDMSGWLNVGLIWAGEDRRDNPEMRAMDARRSIDVRMFKKIFDDDPVTEDSIKCTFFNLQYGPRNRDIQMANMLHDNFDAYIVPLADNGIDDFLDTAAYMRNLDLVVTVDTAAAHLAGAIGVPVILLSRYDGCWRWMEAGYDTPWYPTMEILRQEAPNHWEPVMEKLYRELYIRSN